mmetsp:Transcript_19572/g.30183  ORF Transcript_19572/g.30183 Transcript_19572/m.30183 type:complete len:310 (-) Transcript_19572:44-973(-)|eukprot:CAMPEP_0195282032 /NCGR_PEP_ID=MMETSP0707-20130614/1094_1 /TAXON_ID=33640 /ORGANISM="Asterionellopsis glacialis, Strain CCMP134" /LENGTH=309 /DNA_ID=CAMNT_0040340981 /DNA_START=261 /DNA_END=1190 /DNA_ORIENTATION=-
MTISLNPSEIPMQKARSRSRSIPQDYTRKAPLQIIKVRIPNKPWTTNIQFGTNDSVPNGSESAAVGITSLDRSTALSSEPRLMVGDEVISIDGAVLESSSLSSDTDADAATTIKNATRLLKNAQGPSITLMVIRFGVKDYLPNLVWDNFGPNYEISWTCPTCVVLEPKDNPNVVSSALFPLRKKRFKYELTFQNGAVSHQDLLKLTTIPSEGHEDQLLKIQEDWKFFAEQIEDLEAEMEMDRAEYRYARNEAIDFTVNKTCPPTSAPANGNELPIQLSSTTSVSAKPVHSVRTALEKLDLNVENPVVTP